MNIASVSWADHLTFGEGDGRLGSPDAVARRMDAWRNELGAGALHWRVLRTRIPGRFSAARGYRHPSLTAARALTWDDFTIVPSLAHERGLQAWMYVPIFDEGWPLAPARERARSHHNAMHGQHVAWQSDLTREHPEWLVVDRAGKTRQRGVLSLSHPEVRRALVNRYATLIGPTEFDGLFVCFRSQSRPAEDGDQFGFNEPARQDFERRGGCLESDGFDRQAWRDLLGSYLTMLLTELRDALRRRGRTLGVGVARGEVLGPPLGNSTLQWRDWVRQSLIDHLVIDQNSSQCPSMWHQLWPMHRGIGYVQNYLDPTGLPPLRDHVASAYEPVVSGSATQLFIARQWKPRSEIEERELLATPGVTGLVFSSFRHDNAAAIARGEWRAGAVDRQGSGIRDQGSGGSGE